MRARDADRALGMPDRCCSGRARRRFAGREFGHALRTMEEAAIGGITSCSPWAARTFIARTARALKRIADQVMTRVAAVRADWSMEGPNEGGAVTAADFGFAQN